MPLLLRWGMRFSALFGVGWLLFLSLAPFGGGSFAINDHPVSGMYFLTHAGPFIAPGAALLVVIAFGLRTGRLWMREAIVAFWMYVLGAGTVAMWVAGAWQWTAVAELLVFGGVAAWYLYGAPSVAAYFRALARRSVDTSDAVPASAGINPSV
jgi:hypothetical protein